MPEQVCRQLVGTNWRPIYAGCKGGGGANRLTALASSNGGAISCARMLILMPRKAGWIDDYQSYFCINKPWPDKGCDKKMPSTCAHTGGRKGIAPASRRVTRDVDTILLLSS